jgi:hypothetical protein
MARGLHPVTPGSPKMKYLFVLFALVIIGLSMIAPNQIDLFPERPYHGPYSTAGQ